MAKQGRGLSTKRMALGGVEDYKTREHEVMATQDQSGLRVAYPLIDHR